VTAAAALPSQVQLELLASSGESDSVTVPLAAAGLSLSPRVRVGAAATVLEAAAHRDCQWQAGSQRHSGCRTQAGTQLRRLKLPVAAATGHTGSLRSESRSLALALAGHWQPDLAPI
jgi:hypothetical protein